MKYIQILIIGGFNQLAAAVSANIKRPNLGFESENHGGGGKINLWVLRSTM